nr:ABC transporter permease [uncultured Blautia sp.]
MFKEMMDYIAANQSMYLVEIRTHILISLCTVFFSSLIAIPLGIVCIKYRSASRFISGIVNTARVIPSLALMVLLIPLIGIGKAPAIIALILLAIPPIMLNTIAGYDSIDPMITETAKGMGMDSRQTFLQVQTPLALPLILTGVRTAAVEAVASTSIAAYIGAGGLGDLVFTGIGANKAPILLAGGLTIAVLSILTDLLLSTLQAHVCRNLYTV